MVVEFHIAGRPVAKERPRLGARGVYTPARTMHFERDVASAYLAAGGRKDETYSGPVAICVDVTRPMPSSWPQWRKRNPGRCTVGADGDNILKSICDGLQGVAYRNDAQADYLCVTKDWGDAWGVTVKVEMDDG